MKKILGILFMMLLLVGCTSNGRQNEGKDKVKIDSLDGSGNVIQMEIEKDPKRIAVLDMATLDILQYLGLGDRVVGSAKVSLPYLKEEMNENIELLGTIKEADLEAVMKCDPDVIFIGGRLAASYDALSEIAPVVYLKVDPSIGVVKSVKQNAIQIAKLFERHADIEKGMQGYDARMQALQEKAKGKNAILAMTTSGGLNILGNEGRCSLVTNEIGFENIGLDMIDDKKTQNAHGNEASFEYIVKRNPDYMFVMDRDAAIQSEGSKSAKEIMENALIKKTDAYKNGNIIYLEHPGVWYTAEGGIQALDMMLKDIEIYLK